MNLLSAIGRRTVYSTKEVAGFLGMTVRQIRGLVSSGKLKKMNSSHYPFSQKEVNEFLTRFNCGEITMGQEKATRHVRK